MENVFTEEEENTKEKAAKSYVQPDAGKFPMKLIYCGALVATLKGLLVLLLLLKLCGKE